MRIEFENNQIPVYKTITEDDENIDTEEDIEQQLINIADDLNYTYIKDSSDRSRGIISISDDVNILIKYSKQLIHIYVILGDESKSSSGTIMYNCSNNNADIDEISVSLQIASMVCSEIRKKLI